ncbi:Cytosolic 5\'-nucleotidase III-like protein A (cN-III-like protein A) [Ectocarpus siliculosus]|uniref:5'-nucleotidase n=1 Tax=Ectocarpus siliculosus TaxID=2880 RepID=D8LGH6_ECTSI|nr:Cytosolic 5\'-nucleotidase III-like protein A (cN-III-like protein A) [Ectocarpus siliculosus]|eukprot:CBN75751.1 Cytosolic 5\'-nucleotidase III-like protein A (cN-III-like protein A) [Ectocarpus siliculosus]
MARRWGGRNRGRDTVVVDTAAAAAAAAVEVRSSTPLREGPRRGGSRRRGPGWLFRRPDRAGGRSSGIWGTKDSFRPGGSVLKKKEESVASANIQAFGGPGAYGNPFPSFAGPPGLGGGQQDGPTPDLAGPGAPEVISVDGSIVMVLKPNDLAKKKRKFKQDGANKLQVIATFDHCLTAFHAKDGKTPCLKTTDALEQNQHVMLPEAAKKVRFLRSDFKRRMDEGGKTMTPDERVAALEDNLRKVYSVVAMEGGVHMNSIGPAIESQLDGIPLREGVDDMTAALAWRAIPLTIFCAGYGNVAMEVLRRGSPKITGPGGVFTPHLRLVANFFRPDDTMTIIGMYDTVPLIHEAKKSGATLLEFLRGVRQENAFSARSNVLLLGAELSDIGLGNGLPGVEERITVGFLKLDGHVLDKLPRYAQAYDVVILGDGDMSYANEILHEVVG